MSPDIVTAETKSATLCGFENLAARINEAHELACNHAVNAMGYAVETGRLLLEAKAVVPHGKWLPWLRDNVQFAERTAQAYMRLAGDPRIHDEMRKAPADLSVNKALKLIATPRKNAMRDELEAFANQPPLPPHSEWSPDDAKECAARIRSFDEFLHRHGLCDGDETCLVCDDKKAGSDIERALEGVRIVLEEIDRGKAWNKLDSDDEMTGPEAGAFVLAMRISEDYFLHGGRILDYEIETIGGKFGRVLERIKRRFAEVAA